MKLLVFCANRAALNFQNSSGWQILIAGQKSRLEETLKWFRETPDAKLAVDRSMVHGWRAPDDTLIVFHPSWPFALDAAESLQAVARRRQVIGMGQL